MGKQYKKGFICLLNTILIVVLILSGCSLLPEEESRPSPVIKQMEPIEYEFEMVTRQILVNSRNIYCTYEQLKDESLSFNIANKTVKKVYVETGSQVKKGDLLAEVDLGNIDEKIEDLEYEIELSQIKINQMKRLMDLETNKLTLLFQDEHIEQEEYDTQVRGIKDNYSKAIQNYEDKIFIDRLLLASYIEERDQGRIYAGIDGVVTYVRQNLEGSLIRENDVNSDELKNYEFKKNEAVIKVIDNSKCAFQVETEYAPYLKDGQVVEIKMRGSGGKTYEAIVSHDKDNPNLVYFELPEPDFELEVGDRGSINLILEEKENVLAVSRKAVRNAKDFKYVYYLNEDGIKSMKKVTVGMITTSYVEITSGLEYGDIIITQ
ncbi:MAG: hypothetical protein GX288_08375 [Clostridiales bacterium]|jgi:macrolide-specific efflux system membrane fusion protein|nr:hypothetical protein [Clostridiales bacterium]